MKNLAALLVIFLFATSVLSAQGSVYISTKLGIGKSDPFWPLDILNTQAVARLESTGSPNGSVLDLKNTSGGSTHLGAINFSDLAYTPGQIAYLTSHDLTFRVNHLERMRFNANGFLGIGLTNPQSPVHIIQPAGVTLTGFQPVFNVEYTGTNSEDAVAIRGNSVPAVGKGIGGLFGGGSTAGAFYGGHTGVYSIGNSQDNGWSFGVNAGAYKNAAINSTQVGTSGYAEGHNSTNVGSRGQVNGENSMNYGAYGHANGIGSTNYGVFGTATNGTTNWAGYFQHGNVYINNKLGIGQINPLWPLDVLSNQAVARFESNAATNGSVIELKNTTVGSTFLGAINFSSTAGTHGQIAYLTNNDLAIKVNGSERIRFNAGGFVGIGVPNPLHPVHINQQPGITLTDFQPVLNVEYTGTNNDDAVAVRGYSAPTTGAGIGGLFYGGATAGAFYGGHTGIYSVGYSQNNAVSYGINAVATQNSATSSTQIGSSGFAEGTNTTNYGTRSEANGASSSNYGAYGYATGTSSTNYGVYGTATSGTQNWAGFFDNGNVYIKNNVGIGQISPAVDLDILSPQAVVKMTTSNSANGAVIALNNTTAAPIFLGAINFGDGSSTPGQVAYLADHSFAIRANNAERVRINPSGLFGIGRTPTTNKLEVEGTASKSSSGDWLANSDARLKKNISPLDPEQMIEKLLTLKGVTYEWNDDKTGTERPEGIQYGFTAQNISEAFPSLVEEDAKGYLQTAYGTYDAMMVEALRYLYMENKELKNELEEIKSLIKQSAGK